MPVAFVPPIAAEKKRSSRGPCGMSRSTRAPSAMAIGTSSARTTSATPVQRAAPDQALHDEPDEPYTEDGREPREPGYRVHAERARHEQRHGNPAEARREGVPAHKGADEGEHERRLQQLLEGALPVVARDEERHADERGDEAVREPARAGGSALRAVQAISTGQAAVRPAKAWSVADAEAVARAWLQPPRAGPAGTSRIRRVDTCDCLRSRRPRPTTDATPCRC